MINIEDNTQPVTNVTEEIAERILGKVTWPDGGKDRFGLMPVDLADKMEIDQKYILTCFWSNVYITYLGNRNMTVDRVLGESLQVDREYLLINPAY